MKNEINIKKADVEFMIPQKEPTQGKRWSFSYVYYLEDLRNVYRLYDKYKINSIIELNQKCEELGIDSWNGKAWTQRNLLELVNALKNFHLISVHNNKVVKTGLFSKTRPEDPLTDDEKKIFENIFFSYFRFCEFHKLFMDIGEQIDYKRLTNSVIFYMQASRFTNRFILRIEPEIKIVGLSDEHSDMMRFWDVYIKWGVSLNLLRKYPLKSFGINTIPPTKSLSIVYFYKKMPVDFSVFEYIIKEMQGSYLYIPDVVYSLILDKQYAAEDVLEKIVKESVAYPDVFRAQSTSAIFINDKENFLFPKLGNAYITHLLKI